MKKQSLNLNLILNSIRVAMAIFAPLITFPYVSRILSPALLGEYNYTNSLINYFVLIAGLGVSTYAIRSGTVIRDKKEEFESFISEVFSLNLLSTVISYLLLFLCFIFIDTFKEYSVSVFLFSLSIVFRTIGVEWIFGIFEDYKYVTIRSILFQIVSIVMIFALIKDEQDLYAYILITVLSNICSNICNFLYAKKFCRFRIIFSRKIFSHLKPIVIIFSTTLATIIYINADTTMLGLMCGTVEVGYYSVACKLYNCIKSMLNGMVAVFMARLSYEYKNDLEEYRKTFRYAFELLTCITVPLAVGALFFSDKIILLLSGAEYLKAERGMQVLFVSLLFATLGNLYCSGGLLQAGKEKVALLATAAGAIANVGMNYILISFWQSTGATIATLVTEILVFLILFYNYKRYVENSVGTSHILKCIISTLPFVAIKILFDAFGLTSIPLQIVAIGICGCLYFLVLLLLKDNLVLSMWQKGKSRFQGIKS